MMDDQDINIVPQSTMESLELLRETISRQEAALHAKGRLVDNMAYQIRTLSNAVIGFSDLLLTEDLMPDQRDYAVEINTAGKGLSSLVNEVLDWARLESGRLQITRCECSLRVVLDELDKTVRPVAADKGLTFDTKWDNRLPETVITDPERLLKCLVNLSANAIQYTTEGFVHINPHLEMRNDKPYIRFDVIDSGPGITPERLDRLFEPAKAEEDAHAEVVTMLSLGLSVAAGLPLTRQLAELLGGTVEAHSELGKGSIFSLLIPVGIGTASHSSLDREIGVQANEGKSSPRDEGPWPILLVEDQESNRTVIRLMLKAMGYDVETAVDGQEAVEMAFSKTYCLIIMDLKMPRMDGYEAASCLREKKLDVPIVALSALSLKPEEKGRIAELFDGFLSKPVDSEQLLAAIQKYAVGAAANNNAAPVA